MTIQMQAVQSSNIEEVGYLDGHRVLQVRFKGGRVYRYHDVPPMAWDALQSSNSVGQFVAGFIKGSYDYEQGEYEPCPEPECEWPAGHDEEEQPHGKRIWDD